jgi:hypothetical protein
VAVRSIVNFCKFHGAPQYRVNISLRAKVIVVLALAAIVVRQTGVCSAVKSLVGRVARSCRDKYLGEGANSANPKTAGVSGIEGVPGFLPKSPERNASFVEASSEADLDGFLTRHKTATAQLELFLQKINTHVSNNEGLGGIKTNFGKLVEFSNTSLDRLTSPRRANIEAEMIKNIQIQLPNKREKLRYLGTERGQGVLQDYTPSTSKTPKQIDSNPLKSNKKTRLILS